ARIGRAGTRQHIREPGIIMRSFLDEIAAGGRRVMRDDLKAAARAGVLAMGRRTERWIATAGQQGTTEDKRKTGAQGAAFHKKYSPRANAPHHSSGEESLIKNLPAGRGGSFYAVLSRETTTPKPACRDRLSSARWPHRSRRRRRRRWPRQPGAPRRSH